MISDRNESVIVFDTSTLISAALFPGSIPSQALGFALEHFEVCVSQAMLDELLASLRKPKHERYASLPAREAFFERFLLATRSVTIHTHVHECRDPTDDKVLDLAVAAQTKILVASDADLTSMHPWRGVEILPPRQFLEDFL